MRVMQCKNHEHFSAVSISPCMLSLSYVFAVAHLRDFFFFFFGARRLHFILTPQTELRSCVKVEVDVLGSRP